MYKLILTHFLKSFFLLKVFMKKLSKHTIFMVKTHKKGQT